MFDFSAQDVSMLTQMCYILHNPPGPFPLPTLPSPSSAPTLSLTLTLKIPYASWWVTLPPAGLSGHLWALLLSMGGASIPLEQQWFYKSRVNKAGKVPAPWPIGLGLELPTQILGRCSSTFSAQLIILKILKKHSLQP